MRTISILFISFFIFLIGNAKKKEINDVVIATGKMPNITKDKSNNIHVVYGSGDSIMYVFSKDGTSFISPALIAVLPGLFASAMRGPQIAAADNGVIVTACTNKGNIFSYKKNATGKWAKAKKVNDINESAKEALMALSADGKNVFAYSLFLKLPISTD